MAADADGERDHCGAIVCRNLKRFVSEFVHSHCLVSEFFRQLLRCYICVKVGSSPTFLLSANCQGSD